MAFTISEVAVIYHGTDMRRLAVFTALLAASASGQVLSRADPAQVGLSAERLGRIDTVVRQHVDRREIAGVVTLIARQGRIVHSGVYGMADIEAGKPMQEDTIFRIASMTKPIATTAAMMLYEEGKFLLSDPVGKYIPEFAKMDVLPGPGATNNYRVPAKRPITIRHLLTHTSGLTAHPNPRLGPLYIGYGITHGLIEYEGTILDGMKKLAGLPLLFHPGERFEYGLSLDVVGALVEIWSGMTLDEFLKRRILEPLGMKDTGFFMPDKASRFATLYGVADDGRLSRTDETIYQNGEKILSTTYPFEGPGGYYSGGAGLSSTALDYARFAQMILNQGELGGRRLLSPKTVELMTLDHVGKMVAGGPSFGLGFSVDSTERGFPELTSEGTHGWGGLWYTSFFISPEEEMVGVFMAQHFPDGGLQLRNQLKVLAHQAIID